MNGQFNRQLIAPLIVLAAVLVKQLTGFELADEQVDTLVDAVGILAGVVAAFMKPKK